MSNDATVSNDEDLTHMIIWLDRHIGDPGRYQQLKKAFSTQTDPKIETPVKLVDRDYAEIFDVEDIVPINFEGVFFLLATFTNIEMCLQCFQQNQNKRIFFITSGSLGSQIVPIIVQQFREIFTDPVTNEPYTSIYIYCGNIICHTEWALPYSEYIQMFDHEADLLSRLTYDIADYYFIQSKRLLDRSTSNNEAAYHRLSWARELYERCRTMENISTMKELVEVNRLLMIVEEQLKASSDIDD